MRTASSNIKSRRRGRRKREGGEVLRSSRSRSTARMDSLLGAPQSRNLSRRACRARVAEQRKGQAAADGVSSSSPHTPTHIDTRFCFSFDFASRQALNCCASRRETKANVARAMKAALPVRNGKRASTRTQKAQFSASGACCVCAT